MSTIEDLILIASCIAAGVSICSIIVSIKSNEKLRKLEVQLAKETQQHQALLEEIKNKNSIVYLKKKQWVEIEFETLKEVFELISKCIYNYNSLYLETIMHTTEINDSTFDELRMKLDQVLECNTNFLNFIVSKKLFLPNGIYDKTSLMHTKLSEICEEIYKYIFQTISADYNRAEHDIINNKFSKFLDENSDLLNQIIIEYMKSK